MSQSAVPPMPTDLPPPPPGKPPITELKGALFRLALPEGVVDRSIYMAAFPPVENFQPSLVVTQEHNPGLKDFPEHVSGLVRALEAQLKDYQFHGRDKVTLAGRAGERARFSWTNPKGVRLRVSQWYVYKDPTLFVLNATAPEAAFEKLEAAFEAAVKSFAPQGR
jgi:hypothetical protein